MLSAIGCGLVLGIVKTGSAVFWVSEGSWKVTQPNSLDNVSDFG